MASFQFSVPACSLSHVQLFATPWTVTRQAPLSMNAGVSCHFLLQGIFPTQGLNLCLLYFQADSWPLSYQGRLFKFSTQGLKSKHCISSFGFLDSSFTWDWGCVYIVKPQFALSLVFPLPLPRNRAEKERDTELTPRVFWSLIELIFKNLPYNSLLLVKAGEKELGKH